MKTVCTRELPEKTMHAAAIDDEKKPGMPGFFT
jgi:hypothetical protein